MKSFIAYRSTGEDPKVLEPLLLAIKQALEAKGVEVYSTFFDKHIDRETLSVNGIVEHAFEVIDGSDFVFIVQTSDHKSEGMLIEVGYCLAKNVPFIVATKDSVTKTYLPELASQSFRWSNIKDLTASIADLRL